MLPSLLCLRLIRRLAALHRVFAFAGFVMPLKSKLPQRFLNDVHTESSGPSSATQSTDNNLCHFCRGINIESLSAPSSYEHVPSSRTFSDRCALCKLIRDNSFVKFYFETPLYLELSHHLSDSGSKEAYLTLHNGIDREDPDKTWVFIITEPGEYRSPICQSEP
jgi:hypothetical protein